MARIQIIGIRLEPGKSGIQHIFELLWRDPTLTANDDISKLLLGEGVCSREQLVTWLLIPGNSAFSEDPRNGKTAEVHPHPEQNPYYVRTDPDNEKQDNLLYQSQNCPPVSPYSYRTPS